MCVCVFFFFVIFSDDRPRLPFGIVYAFTCCCCVFVFVCVFFFVPTAAHDGRLISCMRFCVVVVYAYVHMRAFFLCHNDRHGRSFAIVYAFPCCCVCLCVCVCVFFQRPPIIGCLLLCMRVCVVVVYVCVSVCVSVCVFFSTTTLIIRLILCMRVCVVVVHVRVCLYVCVCMCVFFVLSQRPPMTVV